MTINHPLINHWAIGIGGSFFFWLFFCINIAFSQSGQMETCLTNHPANDRYASYSPDGQRIVFESDRSGNWDIFIMDKDGRHMRQITTDTSAERQPSWHPSGRKVLFESNKEGENQFYLYDLAREKTEKVRLPELPGGELLFGRFSPEGERIAFSMKISDSVFHLFVLEISSMQLRQLTSGNFRHTYPNWSPDGKSLVFHARHETGNQDDEIYLMHLKTGKMRRLTNRTKHDFCPAVSPDGKHIVFAGTIENSQPVEIFTVQKNGKNRRQTTWNDLGEVLPSWRPDGKALLVSAWRGGNYEVCEILTE